MAIQNAYLQGVYEGLAKRNPEQKEFLQAEAPSRHLPCILANNLYATSPKCPRCGYSGTPVANKILKSKPKLLEKLLLWC